MCTSICVTFDNFCVRSVCCFRQSAPTTRIIATERNRYTFRKGAILYRMHEYKNTSIYKLHIHACHAMPCHTETYTTYTQRFTHTHSLSERERSGRAHTTEQFICTNTYTQLYVHVYSNAHTVYIELYMLTHNWMMSRVLSVCVYVSFIFFFPILFFFRV